jgi:FkbM family methyltransferase
MCIDYFDKESLERWFKDKGDENHRVNYDLNENSLVIDLGGYLGEWTEKIHNKYSCNVYVFEPVFKYYNNIVEKFKNNNKIKIFNLGLSGVNDEVVIKHDNASSSIFIENGVEEKIKLVKYYDFINDNKIGYIDLIKINIEGSEYELLEHIIENNLQLKIKNLQIQFHKTFNDSEEKREEIRKVLSLTHKLTYDYTFVWENWEKI